MTQYNEKIVNVETGEETIRPYSESEIAEVERNIAANEAKEQEAAAKEAARQAILTKLGLTDEEAKALLG